MKHAILGSGDLLVSRTIFGTWQFGGDWGEFPESDAVKIIEAAFDAGITTFDTAQAYGYGISETVLGKGLKRIIASDRSNVVISTKGGLRPGDPSSRGRDASAAWMRACLEQSLKLLGVEQIDLYNVHWPDPNVDMAETAGFMKDAIDEGLIRYAGVSNFTVAEMQEFSKVCPITSLQPPYHMFRRDIESDLLPYARENDIGVITYSPLASGLLSGRLTKDSTFEPADWRIESSAFKGEGFVKNLEVIERLRSVGESLGISVSQLALAWGLARPGVTGVVFGSRTVKNVVSSAEAADVELSAEVMEKIEVILEDAVPVGGISPEGIE